MDNYIYPRLEEAMTDLGIFSRMSAHEGRVLYLIGRTNGYEIIHWRVVDESKIEALALNGRLFAPIAA